MNEIDLSFAQAAVVMPKEHTKLRIIQVGAGGTGSFTALAIARLMYELKVAGKTAELLIIDPDRVESGNIPRSNFCAAEIGSYKAQSIAKRITLAWGIECHYANELFDADVHLKQSSGDYRALTVIVGCVDNHHARRQIHRAVEELQGYQSNDAPNIWWIDAGNGKFSGQILIGSMTKRIKAENHFVGSSICRSLPTPSLLHPDLLESEKKGRSTELEELSCPDRIRRGEQSLNVNQRVAVEIAEMLAEMFLARSLKRFATYFDLETGTCRSLYCTPDQVAAAVPKK
ncbi:MAG: ThiF family adenylyltransferase [Acidobacteria bacterium]|nr:ThiF family adenylyltransferase [Acidobacteriota bacterium]HMQ04391.1 ThiF family adenylyltransferase [Pyrinomonadaceae bacterium]